MGSRWQGWPRAANPGNGRGLHHRFFFRFHHFHHVLAGGTQRQRQRAGHQYRRVDTEHDADGQRHGKAVQRRAAEQQHGQHHGLGGAAGDEGTAHGGGNGVVDHFGSAAATHGRAAEVFADTVKHHYRFVYRVTQYRQHAGQHGEAEFPLEEGKATQDDHQVVHVGDDGRQRQPPFEADGQVDHDADADQQDGGEAVGYQLFPAAGADELHLAQLHAGVAGFQQAHHLFRQLGRAGAGLVRQADQYVAAGT